MSRQAIASPEELERFAHQLKQFNAQLNSSMKRLNAQFNKLGETWRDREHQKFASEYQETMHALRKFQRASEVQIPFLQRKARRLREYLSQR